MGKKKKRKRKRIRVLSNGTAFWIKYFFSQVCCKVLRWWRLIWTLFLSNRFGRKLFWGRLASKKKKKKEKCCTPWENESAEREREPFKTAYKRTLMRENEELSELLTHPVNFYIYIYIYKKKEKKEWNGQRTSGMTAEAAAAAPVSYIRAARRAQVTGTQFQLDSSLFHTHGCVTNDQVRKTARRREREREKVLLSSSYTTFIISPYASQVFKETFRKWTQTLFVSTQNDLVAIKELVTWLSERKWSNGNPPSISLPLISRRFQTLVVSMSFF